jgi:four helix bundle protein
MKIVNRFDELEVYQIAMELQQAIFELSKKWPNIENHSLTDQVRRSSRPVGANLAEAWAKRRYPAHFLSKLTDSDGELQETLHWITTANNCGYLGREQHQALVQKVANVGGKLGSMINRHESFCF